MSVQIEVRAGSLILEAVQEAYEKATEVNDIVAFSFNDWNVTVDPLQTLEENKTRIEDELGFPLLTRKEMAEKSRADLEEMKRSQAEAIDLAGVATEEQLRDAEVPWPKDLTELATYIDTLVNRPHDYGTVVYAVSMAALATFQYVATTLGSTGFQAGMADLDFIRRSRRIKGAFRLMNYGEMLLYPQYIDRNHFPTPFDSLYDQKDWLKREAEKQLAKGGPMADRVRRHLVWLSQGQPADNYFDELRHSFQRSLPSPSGGVDMPGAARQDEVTDEQVLDNLPE